MGSRHRRSPADVVAAKSQLAILLRAGVYIQEICRQLQLPETSVRRWSEELGLPIQKCRSGPKGASEHPEWRGGRRLDKHGYVYLYMPLHPSANAGGAYFEHRAVVEIVLGRYLGPLEVVDHGDNYPYHNWPSNLTLYASNAEHLRATLSGKPKSTPRLLIPGAYRSTQKIDRCPDEHETLAQCSSEIRALLAWFVESHRPTTEHRMLPRRKIRGLGAHRDPWKLPSTE
jgi:hypothetical protein